VASQQRLTMVLGPDEVTRAVATAGEALVVLTDARVIVVNSERLALAVPVAALRRVELDVERGHGAMLILVPEAVAHDPQMLPVRREELHDIAGLFLALGLRLSEKNFATSSSAEGRLGEGAGSRRPSQANELGRGS
jgi:hypothetical protein